MYDNFRYNKETKNIVKNKDGNGGIAVDPNAPGVPTTVEVRFVRSTKFSHVLTGPGAVSGSYNKYSNSDPLKVNRPGGSYSVKQILKLKNPTDNELPANEFGLYKSGDPTSSENYTPANVEDVTYNTGKQDFEYHNTGEFKNTIT
jgi:hypothetical protein